MKDRKVKSKRLKIKELRIQVQFAQIADNGDSNKNVRHLKI